MFVCQQYKVSISDLPMPDYPQYLDDGEEFSNHLLTAAMDKEDMPALAKSFSVPIVFIQGQADLLTTTALVRDYFDQIVAPSKQLIEVPEAGHNAIFTRREPFLAKLVEVARPLGLRNDH